MQTRLFSRIGVLLLLTVFVVPGLIAGGAGEESADTFEQEYDEWLQEAELGPYQPEEEDWDVILEAAREESPITVYTGTSRALDVIDAYNEEHGLEIEAINLSTNDLIERVRREWDSGIRNAGVVFVGNPGLIQEQLLERSAVTNYVPRELEAHIEPHETEPLLRHRYSVGTWYYNTDDGSDEVPYENIWELTTERWNNRVVVRDPLESGTMLAVFTAWVTNADEMAALYEDYFGEEIELTTPNAGYEFVKRLLDNDLRIVPNARDVAEAVTRADGRMAGMATQSLYRQVIEGQYDFHLDTEVNPTVLTLRLIGLGSMTEGPNQAKLVIRHLMSQEGGEPWWGADFPVSDAVTPTGPMADLTLDTFNTLWEPSVQEQVDTRDEFVDFFLQNR